MKKFTALLTAAAVSFTAASAFAADSRTISINEALSDTSTIHILYNDAMVQYEDVKPLINEDRVMIPFRAALENMGASVDYSDAERLVTATKDGTTISFTLLDDTIYIDNGAEKSEMKMDVPMIIVSDRTLVPIRFMSEAFGMQVGWDGDTRTVVIMDYDNYFKKIGESVPNITRLSSADNSAFNSSSSEFEFSIDAANSGRLTIAGAETKVTVDGVKSIDAEVTVTGSKIKLNKAKLNLIEKDGVVYFNSDVIKQLASGTDNAAIKAAAAIAGADSWFSVQKSDIYKALGADAAVMSVLNAAMSGGGVRLENVLKNGMTTEGEAVFSEAVNLASQLDVYEALDSYVKITDKENGDYTVNIDIKPEDYANIVNASLGSLLDDASLKQIAKSANCTLSAAVEADSMSSSAEVMFMMNTASGGTVSYKVRQIKKTDEAAKAPSVPADSKDITDLLVLLI